MSIPGFSIVPLERGHKRSGFNCGTEILDHYFARRVSQDIRRNLARCFVAIDNENGRIAGFYTLSAAQIPLLQLPEELARQMPRYDAVPASRVGRLAIDQRYQGQGLGSVLLADALKRSASSAMAVYALLVDAKDEHAVKFYRHHGFIPCDGAPRTLFLTMGTFRKI